MKIYKNVIKNIGKGMFLTLLMVFVAFNSEVMAQEDFVQYEGKVIDVRTNSTLPSVNILVKGTNISTITNSDGEYILKIPNSVSNAVLVVSNLGYLPAEISAANLPKKKGKIELEAKITELTEVNLTAFNSAEALVRAVFKDKAKNSLDESVLMTAFYRETIKKRNKNVSLTEAVVNLYKEPYNSSSKDILELHKARKSTDYKRLDTVALKLQGGPFSTLYLDIMKYPEYIFTDRSIGNYEFNFESPSTVNDRPVYVVAFQQRDNLPPPAYDGKLYIDAETFALTSATYSMNLDNQRAASELFVKKKPRDINVYPTRANYKVNYREKNGKWYYSYGNVQLTFKVNKRRKLFNSVYSLSSEMAVTDWESNTNGFMARPKDRLKPTVIIADAVSGFSDPDFWGPYNVIEPEKSIEAAINKIKRKLKRDKS
ncbi:MAG: carboxypeptidase-like regulatory domain-containing protein [Flavobacteriaceae bacterium]|nr:carboxypeptidase-like regulatory domain-containing protein [Flavobacteriaceae bacterium]